MYMTYTVFTNVPLEADTIFMILNQTLYPLIIFPQMVVYVPGWLQTHLEKWVKVSGRSITLS